MIEDGTSTPIDLAERVDRKESTIRWYVKKGIIEYVKRGGPSQASLFNLAESEQKIRDHWEHSRPN